MHFIVYLPRPIFVCANTANPRWYLRSASAHLTSPFEGTPNTYGTRTHAKPHIHSYIRYTHTARLIIACTCWSFMMMMMMIIVVVVIQNAPRAHSTIVINNKHVNCAFSVCVCVCVSYKKLVCAHTSSSWFDTVSLTRQARVLHIHSTQCGIMRETGRPSEMSNIDPDCGWWWWCWWWSSVRRWWLHRSPVVR